MATEAEGGLVFHPMDQFIVRRLFCDEPAETVIVEEAAPGTGTLITTTEGTTLVEPHLTAEVDPCIAEIPFFAITNATLWMALTVAAIAALMLWGTRGRATIPSRLQSVAELAYGFIHKMVEDVAGREALRYFPYILTLFLFILFSNFLGRIPAAYTTTAHIAVTALMALAVFVFVTVLGFVKHGARFLELFWVKAAPLPIRPVLAVIEVISYFVRPLSLSIRLAGNMTAGHAVIKVFAAFAGAALLSPLAILGVVAMYGLEVLVSFIQAYVFTILTCVYLKDALHPHH
jgi:F-type H+-transporting ATPase subunit a